MELFKNLTTCLDTSGGCGWKNIGPIINEVLTNLIMVGIFIAIVMIFYAGIILVQGQDSSSARSRVKKIFINIVGGMILFVGAYYIVKFILDELNVNNDIREISIPKT